MGFIMSPVKLIQVVTTSSLMNEKIEKRSREWYFSKKGEKAYKDAKTTAEKVVYFYNFLIGRKSDPSSEDREFMQSIAYIMAAAIDGTSKPYGTWPAIIDREQNPLVNYALEHVTPSFSTVAQIAQDKDISITNVSDYVKQSNIAGALAAVKGTEDKDLFMGYTPYAHQNLTKYEDDPEQFLLERCIIFTFDDSYYDMETGVGPYNYSALEEEN